MTVYYTKQKAKFGGVTGTIIPFPISVEIPSFRDEILPAGFLKCDGSILKASLYPALAATIGIGPDCKFAKDPDNMALDEIQLPDLGSKYIRSSTASGEYLNDTLVQDPTIKKVGTEIEIVSLIGSEATISYSGTFQVQGQSGIPFNGKAILELQSETTLNDQLSEENFQAHGHNADTAVMTYTGRWTDNFFISDFGARGGNEAQTEAQNDFVLLPSPDGATTLVSHNHSINLPSSAELTANDTQTMFYDTFNIPADGLTSTVTVTTEDTIKLDDVTPPFYIVEYIIKV